MGRITRLLLLIVLGLLFFPNKAFADTSCQPIYGGGQTCTTTGNISINKTVMNPQANKMVDNLSINDPRYKPGFIVTFQINLTNTGNSNVSKINVADVFPQYLNFSSGPGNFNSDTRTLSFEVDNLASNESRTFTIMGKITDANQIPLDKGIICVVNQATATNLDSPSQSSQDNSQLCIEKAQGFPIFSTTTVTVTPATGPEMFGLIVLIPTGIAGFMLRKYTMTKENLK